jgi:hypothetical protein
MWRLRGERWVLVQEARGAGTRRFGRGLCCGPVGWSVSLGLDLCLSLGRLGGGLRGGGRETGGEEGEEEDGGGRRRGRYRISAFELA